MKNTQIHSIFLCALDNQYLKLGLMCKTPEICSSMTVLATNLYRSKALNMFALLENWPRSITTNYETLSSTCY